MTAVLADAAGWAGWLAVGTCLLALVPVLRAFRSGCPFAAGNARSFTWASVVAVVGWAAAFGLPVWAADRALLAGDSGLPAEWFLPDFAFEWWPVWLAIALAVIAGIFTAGSRVAAETNGLV